MLDVTWDSILQRLDSVLAFARPLDLEEEVARSRFLHHRQRLVDLTTELKAGGANAALAVYNTDRLAHIVALAEAFELALVEPFLRATDPKALRPKLRDALGGPVLPSEEDQNSNHARNILFELNMASKLSAAGVAPTIGDRPDLSCEVNGTKLLIECKRPLTERGARTRISKAWESLVAESEKDGPSTRGVAALSIAKLIQDGGQMLTAANAPAVRPGLGELINHKATWLNDSWGRHGTKVIGIQFHVITPAFLQDSKMLGLVEQTHSYGLAREGSRDWRTFRELRARLDANES